MKHKEINAAAELSKKGMEEFGSTIRNHQKQKTDRYISDNNTKAKMHESDNTTAAKIHVNDNETAIKSKQGVRNLVENMFSAVLNNASSILNSVTSFKQVGTTHKAEMETIQLKREKLHSKAAQRQHDLQIAGDAYKDSMSELNKELERLNQMPRNEWSEQDHKDYIDILQKKQECTNKILDGTLKNKDD